LLGNLRLKLVALFFAAALWSVVAYTSNPTQTHHYNMAVSNPVLPAGLVVVGAIPQVTVTVIAAADNLRAFDPHQLRVSANFSNVKVGTNQVPIRVDNSDPSVQVDAPSTIPVKVDQLGTTNLNVSIERTHSLLTGFHEETGSTSVTPATVRVDGPKSQLKDIQAVVVVDLTGVSAPGFSTPYPVQILDANKKGVTSMTVTPLSVTVKMVIQADAITVNKAVGFSLTGQPAAGYRITNVQIAPLVVQATGLQNILSGIGVLSTDPVDVGNAKGDVVKTVSIRPPNGVEVSQKTATVHVFISAAPGVSPSASP